MKPLIHSKPSGRICEAGSRGAGYFSNGGTGKTGFRALSKPIKETQSMKRATRILQPAVSLRDGEKLFPAQCDHAGRPNARSQAVEVCFLVPHAGVKRSEGASYQYRDGVG